MSKLNYKNPLENSALFAASDATEETRPEETGVRSKGGRPKHDNVQRTGAGKGLKEGTTRYTVIFHYETIDFLQDYAYTKRKSIKEALRDIVGQFEQAYKADPNNEPIIPDPQYIAKREERDNNDK